MRWWKSWSQANKMLDVCFQTRLCLFFASSRLKMIPVPHDKPYSAHIKWLQKTFPGPFSISMEWCYYISPLPLISSLMKAGCLSLYHSVSPNPFSFWKSSVFHYPLCVSLYHIFFSSSFCSQTFVFIFLGLQKKKIIPLLINCTFFYSHQVLTNSVFFFPQPSVPCLSKMPLHLYFITNFLILRLSFPIPPSFFLCFSSAVRICPPSNCLSHLNDGCLCLKWQPRSNSFSLCLGAL